KQDFYVLDFHFLQDAAAGGVAKLRRRWSGEQPACRLGAAAELVVLQGAALLFPLRRGHRTRLSSKTCRARTARTALRLDFSWFFFLVAKLLPFLLLAWAALLSYFQPPSMTALRQVSLRNFYGLPWDLMIAGALNTLLLMLAVPTLTLILCLAISWVILRSDLKWRVLFFGLGFFLPPPPPPFFSISAGVFSRFVFFFFFLL